MKISNSYSLFRRANNAVSYDKAEFYLKFQFRTIITNQSQNFATYQTKYRDRFLDESGIFQSF